PGTPTQTQDTALALALTFEDAGAAAVIYTDINRDGAMGGVNVDQTVNLAFHLTTPVIASGGVSSLDDLRELKQHEDSGIIGVVAGRSLYDGRIALGEALKLLKSEGPTVR
ncbi:MAG: HisA/HisF-related TIM barrel protein, partial [Reyranellaceae bacterium]